MRDVVIIGIGQTPVGEHWEKSLRHLAHDAIMAAMRDAGIETADALYVGNMLSGQLAGQEHLGALIADFIGLRGIEAMKVEAACGSGAAALRVGLMAVASGMQDVVLVCGVEKMTDALSDEVTSGLATAADQEYEVSQGISFVGLNALLMRRYMHEYGVTQGPVCAVHRQRAPQRRQQPVRHVPQPRLRVSLRQGRHDRRPDQPDGLQPGVRRRRVRRAGARRPSIARRPRRRSWPRRWRPTAWRSTTAATR